MSINLQLMNLGHGEGILLMLRSKKETDHTFHLLIDGGSENATRDGEGFEIQNDQLMKLLDKKEVNGIIVTHIDDDHIGGILHLLRDEEFDNNQILFFIFNQYVSHEISFRQAEILETLLAANFKASQIISSCQERYIAQNNAIQRKSLLQGNRIETQILSVHARKGLKKVNEDILYITMLAPKNQQEIAKFMAEWKRYKNDKNYTKSSKYAEIVNEASIAVLLEYEGKKLVFAGDSKIEIITDSLQCINEKEGKKMQIDCIKLCHHGAFHNNIGIVDLLKKYKCKTVVYSTNSRNHFQHPDVGMLHNIVTNIPNVTIYATNQLTHDMIKRQVSEDMKDPLAHHILLGIRNVQVGFTDIPEEEWKIEDSKLTKILRNINYKTASKNIYMEVLRSYIESEVTLKDITVNVEWNSFLEQITNYLEAELRDKIHVVEGGELIEL